MKLLMPLICLTATAVSVQSVMAASQELEQYRLGNYLQAAEFLPKVAAGDPVAAYYLGRLQLYGYGKLKNDTQALAHFQRSAEKGYLPAQQMMARFMLLEAHDPQKALHWFKKIAAANDVQAQMYCVAAHLIGFGVRKNPDAARPFYLAAAKNGDALAQYLLAEHFLNSRNAANKKLGVAWLEKSANQGNSKAQLKLAELYATGGVVKKDLQRAEMLSAQASARISTTPEHKAENAEAEMALWLSQGRTTVLADAGYQLGGILNDWQNKAMLQENHYNAFPQMPLVVRQQIYQPEFQLIQPNSIAMSTYYDALMLSRVPVAETEIVFPDYPLEPMPEVTLPFEENDQIEEDSQEDGFQEAEERQPGTQAVASAPMLSSDVLEQRYLRAVHGDNNAQFALGQMYQQGIGVEPDIHNALRFYYLAADQKDLRAKYTLGILYLEGKAIGPDYQQAIVLLREAAFAGNAYAQYALARIKASGYRDSEGVLVIQSDPEESESMYYLAAGNGYGPAQYELAERLIREKPADSRVAAQEKHDALIKTLYQHALNNGVQDARLPLAFFDATDADEARQKAAYQTAKTEAEQGNGQAALLLGLMLDRGLGVEVDHKAAMAWYQKAPSTPASAFILGTYLSQSGSRDAQQGRELLQHASDNEFSSARVNLAVLKNQSGEAFVPDLSAAMDAGNSEAGILLADYYLSKAESDLAMQQAKQIYQAFAEKGDRMAQLKLAFMLEQGLGGRVDTAGARTWYLQAAEQGQPVAQYLLARLYQLGDGGALDYAEAKKWYAKAQKQFTPAAIALGFVYDTVDDNYPLAFESYELAASQKDAIAQFNLGLMYEQGKGRAVDQVKAKALYLEAAKQGVSQAMVQLAGLLLEPALPSRDEKQALQWYHKAASQGDRDALYQLGLLAESGVATSINFPMAVRYYEQASAKGNTKAVLALARMYQYGLGVEANPQEALVRYQQLAKQGNAFAQYQLATFYYEGIAVERKPEEGKRLLEEASRNGSLQAGKVLQWLGAHAQERFSFIEPIPLQRDIKRDQSVSLMYLEALNEWNRGDEMLSRALLNQIRQKFPDYMPAKRTFEQLQLGATAQGLVG